MDHESRLKTYMGHVYDHDVNVRLSDIPKHESPSEYIYHVNRNKDFNKNTSYYHDLTRYIHPINHLHRTRFLFYPHDRVEPFSIPVIVKSRSIHIPGMSVLLNLNTVRHFMPIFDMKKKDIPFEDKKDILLWRGADTGYGFENNIPYRECSRETLVRRYHDSHNPIIDIGLSSINTNEKHATDYSIFMKPSLSMKEMLGYKFILSVEGNDVASNLKWVLASGSVPFCPPFQIQSWILEDHLVAWEHFIPVRADFADLEARVEWAIHHPEFCQYIADNGKQYMQQFLDVQNERKITTELLLRYAQHVRII